MNGAVELMAAILKRAIVAAGMRGLLPRGAVDWLIRKLGLKHA